MTPDEKERVVEILELAHGYAILGSIIPFKEALLELGAVKSKPAVLAGFAIAKVAILHGFDLADPGARKPSGKEYETIIVEALDYVTTGALPPKASA